MVLATKQKLFLYRRGCKRSTHEVTPLCPGSALLKFLLPHHFVQLVRLNVREKINEISGFLVAKG